MEAEWPHANPAEANAQDAPAPTARPGPGGTLPPEAVELVAEGLAVFDPCGRPRFANEAFRGWLMALGLADPMGLSYAQLVEQLADRRLPDDADTGWNSDGMQRERWLDAWYAADEGPRASSDIQVETGIWLRAIRRCDGDGRRTLVLVDVSDDYRRLQQLEDETIEMQEAMMQEQMVQARLEAQTGEVVRLAEELDWERSRSEEANRAKSTFMRTMSHELRTPLNSIQGFADMLHAETFGPLGAPQYKEYLGDIKTSAAHMLKLINQILDLAKIEAGRYEITHDFQDFARIVRAAVRIVGEAAERKGVILTADVPASTPVAMLDETAVSQVMINIVSNAIKFTEPGGKVHVVSWAEEATVCAAIIDTGCGISEADLGRILRPFEQAGDTTTRARGTGLGLPISKALVELHGGLFTLASEPGHGTTITVRLPRIANQTLDPALYEADRQLRAIPDPTRDAPAALGRGAANGDATTATEPDAALSILQGMD